LLTRAAIILLLLNTPAFADDTPTWTYDGDQTNEEAWGNLSHLYINCALGKEQSPINIAITKPSSKPPLAFHYKPSKATVKLENHALNVAMQDAMVISSDARDYTLESISFHTPGEHMVNGNFYLVEIELLHHDKDGNPLIVSVFGQRGEANAAVDAIVKNPSPTFDPTSLLPAIRGYYAYRGSLTAPPCTEGVEWRILKTPITLSQAQLEAIGNISGRNARLTQPVYMREVEEKN
jgi:carbonic anhydrase